MTAIAERLERNRQRHPQRGRQRRPVGDQGGDDEARRGQKIGRDREIADQPLPREQPQAQRERRHRIADKVVSAHGASASSIFWRPIAHRDVERFRGPDAGVGVGLAEPEPLLARGSRRFDGDFRNRPSRPRRHHHDPVRKIDALEHRMGHEHHRRAERRPKRRQIVIELEAGDLVESGERLVHQEDRRPRHQGAGDRHTHLHAAGELARIGLGETGQPDLLQRLFDARPSLFLRHAGQAQRQPHVGEHVGPRRQRRLLKHEAELGAFRRAKRSRPGSAPRGPPATAGPSTCRNPRARAGRETRPPGCRGRDLARAVT